MTQCFPLKRVKQSGIYGVTMDDRELLELAALAAGLVVIGRRDSGLMIRSDGCRSGYDWNPITDDGDALRLSAALSIDVLHRFVGGQRVEALAPGKGVIVETCDSNTRAQATRLAITRAAAEIGICTTLHASETLTAACCDHQ